MRRNVQIFNLFTSLSVPTGCAAVPPASAAAAAAGSPPAAADDDAADVPAAGCAGSVRSHGEF